MRESRLLEGDNSRSGRVDYLKETIQGEGGSITCEEDDPRSGRVDYLKKMIQGEGGSIT